MSTNNIDNKVPEAKKNTSTCPFYTITKEEVDRIVKLHKEKKDLKYFTPKNVNIVW